MEKYFDRTEAGKVLAEALKPYVKNANAIVLALPRGGVPVAYEIAKKLAIPLDVFIVRKLGVPEQEELAMGAIASGETVVFNNEIIKLLNISKADIDHVIQSEKRELKRRELAYRDDRPFPSLADKLIILVDDGIATGATMKAAIKALRLQKPASIIMAVPVAANATCEEIAGMVDGIVCPLRPINFYAVGAWYENFSQTSDDEVTELLAKANKEAL
ncbi:MAG: phosphoribosyltransferase [Gammaproteobacteria bacterium]|nr:phosphoribosyltransferase [Gammaproteobacteria bacterium]